MLSFGLAVILAKYGMGVFSLVWSTLVFILFRSVAFIVSGLRRKIKLLKFSFRETKTFYRTGGYYTAEQFVNYLSREIDILIIGKYFSPEMLGLYSLSKQLANRPTALVNPIFVKISAPIFSKLQAGNEFLKIGYRRLLNIIVAINTPIYMILFIFAKPIVTLVYGIDYVDAVFLVRVFSIYMLFIALRNPVGSLTIGTGRTDLGFYWTLITIAASVMALIISLTFGINSIAISITAVIILLYLPMYGFIIKKITNMTIKEFITAHIPDYKWLILNVKSNIGKKVKSTYD